MSNQPTLPGRAFITDRTTPKVSDIVLKMISGRLNRRVLATSETVRNQAYETIVDMLPAGSIPEEVADAVENLYNKLLLADLQPEVTPTDVQRIDGFISHICQHINQQPIGGYDTEQSRVAIIVGKKTFEFYDHAALMQSLINILDDLKTEL